MIPAIRGDSDNNSMMTSVYAENRLNACSHSVAAALS